jgi:phage N-6-adenine-methyltransferase
MTLVMERAHELASDIGEVSAVGWHGPAGMEFDEWVRVGNTLQQVGNSINWWVGDWLNYGEAKWGEMYAQAIEITGWEYQRLANAKSVAASISFSSREEKLSWTHHREVAKLPSEQQRFWLTKANEESLSSSALRDAIRQSQLPPPAPVDDVPFSSASPRVEPIHTNGNGYHTPVDEYEQQSSAWEESHNGYTWTAPEPSIVDVAEQVGYRLAAANHAISDDPNYDGDEWYTPQEYINAAAEVMGCIDVDPASCDAAQKFVNAATYYTKQDNGLEYPWIGNAWINPPYSMPLIQQFVEKLIAEYENGNISQAVIITNNSSDTRWFHTLLSRFPACFTRGRVQFWRPNHDTFGTRQGQTLFYVGPNVLKFEAVFSRFGIVVTKL